MEQLSEHFSDTMYADGLQTADEQVLEQIYSQFRRPVVRAISNLGGSAAAGGIFFQTAIIEAARQMRAGAFPEATPFYAHLEALALTHFKDWLIEREQPVPEPIDEAHELPSENMPSVEQLRATRADILAWRRPERGIEPVFQQASEKMLWEKMRVLERRIADGEPVQGTRKGNLPLWIIYSAIGLLVCATAYFVLSNYLQTRTPAQVYESNFTPPKSIMEDIARLENADSSTQRIEICMQRMQDADLLYKQKDYVGAADKLEELAQDDDLAMCQSDALFYLGVIGLQMNRPDVTLQSFAKIENIERYGEDLYWYQALAFVKLAAQNPAMREKAAGAVERARSNTLDPKRRNQAEKMLKELSE
jgi:hypothetical protein